MNITPTLLYKNLSTFFGKQKWWPVDDKYHNRYHTDPRSEIIIGTILTQNTAWKNVEKVLNNLKKTQNLSINPIANMSDDELKKLIKSSGYYNQKTDRLKHLMTYFMEDYNSDLSQFFSLQKDEARKKLLSIKGIGPETADSILLYAGNYQIFVVDTYTKRISKRLPILIKNDSYNEIQQVFETDLAGSYPEENICLIYQQLHAMIVELAKNFCKVKPECKNCPIQNICSFH